MLSSRLLCRDIEEACESTPPLTLRERPIRFARREESTDEAEDAFLLRGFARLFAFNEVVRWKGVTESTHKRYYLRVCENAEILLCLALFLRSGLIEIKTHLEYSQHRLALFVVVQQR